MQSLPYFEIGKNQKIICKGIPPLEDDSHIEHWGEILIKQGSNTNINSLLESYLGIIKEFINADKESIVTIMNLIKYYWAPYLYPKIYVKCVKEKSNEFKYILADIDSENTGYHPCCTLELHVDFYNNRN